MIKIIPKYNNMYSNSYLIDLKLFSIIIDPSIPYSSLEDSFKNKLEMVFVTHFHYDHVTCLKTYLNHNLTFYIHINSKEKLSDSIKNVSNLFGENFNIDLNGENVIWLNDNDHIITNECDIDVVYLPGHSNCSVAYLIENNLFSGDVIFKGSIGRCDLYSGNRKKMRQSLNILKNMPNYKIFPGHGEETTINNEKINNPFLNEF